MRSNRLRKNGIKSASATPNFCFKRDSKAGRASFQPSSAIFSLYGQPLPSRGGREGRRRQESPHSHPVVGDSPELDHSINLSHTAMAILAHEPYCLHPVENLGDQLASALANRVARKASRALAKLRTEVHYLK
jgi:hypothetical protein